MNHPLIGKRVANLDQEEGIVCGVISRGYYDSVDEDVAIFVILSDDGTFTEFLASHCRLA